MDVCENYWDACISDNVLAKYDDTIKYGRDECRKVTDKACGSHRVDEFSIPGSEPEDTTLGAFDLGPYSTVSQVTVPRISLGSAATAAVSGISGSTRVVASTTAASGTFSSLVATVTGSGISPSLITQSPSSTVIAQVTEASKARRRAFEVPSMFTINVAGAWLLHVLMI